MKARTLRAMAHIKAALEHMRAAEKLLGKDYDYDNQRLSEAVRASTTPLIVKLKAKLADLLWSKTKPAVLS
jgi:hypothetical protein